MNVDDIFDYTMSSSTNIYAIIKYYSDIYHKPELIQPLFLGNASRYGPILSKMWMIRIQPKPRGAKGNEF